MALLFLNHKLDIYKFRFNVYCEGEASGRSPVPTPGAGPVTIPRTTKSPRRRSSTTDIRSFCFQILRKTVVCIVLHPVQRDVERFPTDAEGLCLSWTGDEHWALDRTPAIYTSMLCISWVNGAPFASAFRARGFEAQSSHAWDWTFCSSTFAMLDYCRRVAVCPFETFLCLFFLRMPSCMKTAAGTSTAWYQPQNSCIVSYCDCRRHQVCFFFFSVRAFDGSRLLVLKLFCKLCA